MVDSLTTSSKSSGTKKQESLFEPHFDSVVEEKENPYQKNILPIDSIDDKKTQNEYTFNNLDESVLSMDVIDHEIVDFIDQVEIDFDTISENKYEKQNFLENLKK